MSENTLMVIVMLSFFAFVGVVGVYSTYTEKECKLAYSTSNRPVSEIIELCK